MDIYLRKVYIFRKITSAPIFLAVSVTYIARDEF